MPILKQVKQHKILLDTHVWIWLLTGNSILSQSFITACQTALSLRHVLVPPMSIWEIGMLVDKKRMEMEMDVLDWVTQALDDPGIQLCPVTPRIAIQSTRLPGNLHGDPVDRLLIASAYEENATLVTCDKKILSYGADKFISVFDPSKN